MSSWYDTRSLRRTLLDEALDERVHLLTGTVLDVGGKREAKRGRFRPPQPAARTWKYLNIDASTEPDYLCRADAIPVGDAEFDSLLLTEVLEHLDKPEATLREMARVLKPGGHIVLTVPFMHPVHGDPFDFQRWTPDKLTAELETAGFDVVELEPMGSLPAVLYDLCWVTFNAYSASFAPLVRSVAALPFLLLKPVVRLADRGFSRVRRRLTTGYVVAARRTATAGVRD